LARDAGVTPGPAQYVDALSVAGAVRLFAQYQAMQRRHD
jgi:hypothetical protein